jgi:hypothetical protein
VNYDLAGAAIPFAGQSWTRIGVDSNGYVVMGGGGSEDNNCCNLPTGPDAAPPNNVLAPFWTDLDGSTTEGILVGFLGTATDEWLVIEWRVAVFGTDDVRTFQVWLGDQSSFDDDGEEDIAYTYASPPSDPNGQPFLVGAENQLGQGDMASTLPAGDLVVSSTDLVPGDSVDYLVRVRGQQSGTGTVTTSMEASTVPGTTVVSTNIRVLR